MKRKSFRAVRGKCGDLTVASVGAMRNRRTHDGALSPAGIWRRCERVAELDSSLMKNRHYKPLHSGLVAPIDCVFNRCEIHHESVRYLG